MIASCPRAPAPAEEPELEVHSELKLEPGSDHELEILKLEH